MSNFDGWWIAWAVVVVGLMYFADRAERRCVDAGGKPGECAALLGERFGCSSQDGK